MTLTPIARVGDKLVVPACDVGEVMAIETLPIAGDERTFYRIEFPEGGQSWVPLGTLPEKRIRKVMSRENALEALVVMAAQEAPEKRANWNQRKRRYQEMVMDNSPKLLATLLGELAAVRRTKGTLSFSENKVFEQVRGMLKREMSLALGLSVDAVETRLECALAG